MNRVAAARATTPKVVRVPSRIRSPGMDADGLAVPSSARSISQRRGGTLDAPELEG
jgi:hypothetical protein